MSFLFLKKNLYREEELISIQQRLPFYHMSTVLADFTLCSAPAHARGKLGCPCQIFPRAKNEDQTVDFVSLRSMISLLCAWLCCNTCTLMQSSPPTNKFHTAQSHQYRSNFYIRSKDIFASRRQLCRMLMFVKIRIFPSE